MLDFSASHGQETAIVGYEGDIIPYLAGNLTGYRAPP